MKKTLLPTWWKTTFLAGVAATLAVTGVCSAAESKDATEATKKANAAVLKALPFADKQDFEFAHRGFIARPKSLIIKDANGKVVWDMESYQFIGQDKAAPDSVNPSLWRNAQLNTIAGLFKVSDRIYQVRGYDLSNITFIQGDTGWIVFDPLISAETAKAAYDLVSENLGKKPVLAVVYSHSHVDHYGGVRGVVDEADVKSGKVKIFAPDGFMEHAISENVTAGNAMSRRAIYMYGALLPRNEKGGVNGGLGQTTSTGTTGADSTHRHHHQDRSRGEDRRRDHGVPDDPGHRSAGGDEHLVPAVQGTVDGRELHGHPAQPLHPAGCAGA